MGVTASSCLGGLIGISGSRVLGCAKWTCFAWIVHLVNLCSEYLSRRRFQRMVHDQPMHECNLILSFFASCIKKSFAASRKTSPFLSPPNNITCGEVGRVCFKMSRVLRPNSSVKTPVNSTSAVAHTPPASGPGISCGSPLRPPPSAVRVHQLRRTPGSQLGRSVSRSDFTKIDGPERNMNQRPWFCGSGMIR